TGVGIAPDLLPRVFDLFTQGDRSPERAEGGLGIGLAVVRRLVEAHDGRVEAASDGAGCGSEIIVRLPRLPLLARPMEAAETARASNTPGDGRPRHAGPRRVLVIDDHRDAAESMTVLLELWGHEVRIAYDGEGVVGLAAEYRPDAVLL